MRRVDVLEFVGRRREAAHADVEEVGILAVVVQPFLNQRFVGEPARARSITSRSFKRWALPVCPAHGSSPPLRAACEALLSLAASMPRSRYYGEFRALQAAWRRESNARRQIHDHHELANRYAREYMALQHECEARFAEKLPIS